MVLDLGWLLMNVDYGNSYAQTLGQQVYGSYLHQVEDVLPACQGVTFT